MELLSIYLSAIDASSFKVIARSSRGDSAEADTRLPFFETDDCWRTTLIKALAINEYRPAVFPEQVEQNWLFEQGWLSHDRNSFHPTMLARIGQSMYKALFPSEEVRALLQSAITRAEASESQLHIQLEFNDKIAQRSRLPDYPWELVHDGQGFLAHHQVRFSRYINYSATAPNLPLVDKLKVLIVSSGASDEENGLLPLSKKEQKAIFKGLKKAQEDGHIQIDVLEIATINHLRAYLSEYQPHVFHFDGHGLFGRRCHREHCRNIHTDLSAGQCKRCGSDLPEPQGYLVFETEDDEANYVSATEIGELLQKASFQDRSSQDRDSYKGIAVAVLSACKSGMALGGKSVFNGLAQRLISHRVPAVVAMQYNVRVDGAVKFAEQFYRSLGRKNELATAMSHGQSAMGSEGNQWYRPVLYLRWQDNAGGQLFNLEPLLDSSAVVDIREPYLAWLVRQHNRLELRGVQEIRGYPTVELERVFVALKGDLASSTERFNAYEALKREEREFLKLLPLLEEELTSQEIEEELAFIRRQILVGHPLSPALVERDRPSADLNFQPEVVTLGKAFQRERWLVILGDPGSGKTTLARWLTIKLAKAMIDHAKTVTVSLEEVDPEVRQSSEQVSLGPARLPVLLRVSDYAEIYEKQPTMLIDYLGHHPWFGQRPSYGGELLSSEQLNKFIKTYLRKGEAVVILDGLDEINGLTAREEIVREIETFIEDWINNQGQPKSQMSEDFLWNILDRDEPVSTGGNQIIVTSRIVGYHASPLRGNLAHVTIEPMRRIAVEHFCDTWTQAIYRQIESTQSSEIGRFTSSEDIAIKESEALKAAIYDPERPRIRELASNPLLVTILGLVFHSQGSLPQQRAELYQRAMDILIEDWRKTGLSSAELSLVLSPLAAHIHQNYATGLIQHKELKELVAKYLSESPSFQSRNQVMDDKIEDFLRIIREDVGLLAARGEFLYGFLHLTFQEYLAALYLVRSKVDASQEIIDRLSDPRWQEPILLALGYVSSTWGPVACESMLKSLLKADDPLGDLLPRTPLLMVTAMDEMAEVSDSVVREVAQRLLYAYANRDRLVRFKELRSRIERAFTRLYSGDSSKTIEKWLCEILVNPPGDHQDLAPACATLILQHKWFTDATVRSLLKALPQDSKQWGYPINKCLQEILSPQPELDEPAPPKIPTDEEWEALQNSDFIQYQELKRNTEIAQAAYLGKIEKYNRLKQNKSTTLPLDGLPFKKTLQQNTSLVNRIKSHPDWLRLVVALYGGYYDYRAPQVLQEYRDIASFLQKPDQIRRDEISRDREYYVGRFGANDTVYDAAVYLDNNMGGRLTQAKKIPEFSADAIYRDSPLTNRLLTSLRQNEPAIALVPDMKKIWAGSHNLDQKADALIALAAIGEDVIPLIEKSFSSDEQLLSREVLTRLERLKALLRDPITRALEFEADLAEPVLHPEKTKNKDGKYITINKRRQLLLTLENLSSELSESRWIDVFSTLTNLTLTYSDSPLNYATWEGILSPKQSAFVHSEFWVYRFLGVGDDDYIYSCALALDKMVASSPTLIVDSLSLLHQTQNLNWDKYMVEWVVEPLPPRTRASSDIPLEAIYAIENINTEKLRPDFLEMIRSLFLDGMLPLVKDNPDLHPEILTLNLLNPESGERVLESLAPQLKYSYDKPAKILQMVERIRNPYYRSRALFRLAQYLPFRFGHLFHKSITVARTICDHHLRCRVFEYLLPYIASPDQEVFIGEILQSARNISDFDDKARTLARLSRRCSESQKKELLRDSLIATSTISSEQQKAETLQGLRPFLSSYPDLLTGFHRIAKGISDPWVRAKGMERRGSQLLQIHHQLQAAPSGAVDLWSPVILGATINEVLAYFIDAAEIERQWLVLSYNPGQTQANELYSAGVVSGLTLTYTAVRTVDQLIESGYKSIVHSFLPLLQDPTPDAFPTIERWLTHWDETVSSHAALFLSENGRRLTPQTITGLISLISCREDRSRLRAALVLHGGITAVKREKRFFHASELDKQVLSALGQALLDYRQDSPFIKHVIRQLQYDIVFDTPSLIKKWAEAVACDSDEAQAAEQNLMGIAELTPEGWRALREAFELGNHRVREAIMHSLCWLAIDDNIQKYTEDPNTWITKYGLERMDSIRALPRLPCPIIDSAVTALEQKRNDPKTNLLAAAEVALYRHTLSAAKALAEAPSKIKDTLAQIALSNTSWLGTGGSIFKDASEKYAVLVEDKPEVFNLLLAWLKETLTAEAFNDSYFNKCTLLLADVVVYAERSPSTFAKIADDLELAPLIADAAVRHDKTAGRVAAIRLIGYLNKVSISTVDALQQALLDNQDVRQAAIETFTRLQRVEGEIVDELFNRLYDSSSIVAYTSAQTLSLMGRSEKTKPAHRQRILTALADAVRSPESRRGIYAIVGTGGDQSSYLRLSFQGQLDQMIFRSLLEVAGAL